MKHTTLIKDKEAFVEYAKEHNLPQIAEHFDLPFSYVKNYVGNHGIPHKRLDIWHGMSKHRLYIIYSGMLARCYNVKHVHYKDYGGRGITVCSEWRQDRKKFFSWALEHGYKDNLQLDRINCNGNYSPDNCRFVTNLVNQNNRRCTVFVGNVPIGIICANKECNPLALDEKLVSKRFTGDFGRLKPWGIVLALATPLNTKRGSHAILPFDVNVKDRIERAIMKLNKEYETT
jgi:hypothetical protein